METDAATVQPASPRPEGTAAPRPEDNFPPKDSCLFESGTAGPLAMKTRILYLGSVRDYDTKTAELLLNFLRAQTGNRGLIVVHPKGTA